MITRTEAERIAQSIHAVRADWPVASLTTFIERDLSSWPLLDAYVALAYVAIERAGGSWVSATPARVKENGPWRRIGTTDPAADEAREKAAREREERLAAIKARNRAIRLCDMCNDQGYLGAVVCDHETEQAAAARRGAARARAALAAALSPHVPKEQP